MPPITRAKAARIEIVNGIPGIAVLPSKAPTETLYNSDRRVEAIHATPGTSNCSDRQPDGEEKTKAG